MKNDFSCLILDIIILVAVFEPKGKVFLYDVRMYPRVSLAW